MTQGGSDDVGVREGETLAGKYRIERVLGIGGMGVVVAAHHIQLDEKVALKFLLPRALGDVEAVARFEREARNAVKIKSEHVARVTDVGALPNGAPYMVMEYLEGGDLAAWVKQRGALPIEQAVEFVLQACIAVADAHALGIVHRDLKPANLYCIRRSDGQLSIKVLDFGISKLTGRSGPGSARGMAFTKTSALMGSPLYMSPEQMRSSKDVDAQTDIWALGIILFELMVGRPPFLAESVTELAIKAANAKNPRAGRGRDRRGRRGRGSRVWPDDAFGIEPAKERLRQRRDPMQSSEGGDRSFDDDPRRNDFRRGLRRSGRSPRSGRRAILRRRERLVARTVEWAHSRPERGVAPWGALAQWRVLADEVRETFRA